MPRAPLDTPRIVIFPVALIAPETLTPVEVVANVDETLLAAIKPLTRTHPAPEQPNVLSIVTEPGSTEPPVPMAPVVIAPPAALAR